LQYDVTVLSKHGLESFGPSLPAVLKCDHDHRRLLLTKLVNAERASIDAPVFRPRRQTARSTLLDQLRDYAQNQDSAKQKHSARASQRASSSSSSSPSSSRKKA
jgi:hypothetical protein